MAARETEGGYTDYYRRIRSLAVGDFFYDKH